MNRLLLFASGGAFALGFLTCWIVGLGSPELDRESVAQVVDTLRIPVYDTVRIADTTNQAAKVIYKTKLIQTTDTVYATVEKFKRYDAEKTFSDSAWIKHIFDLDDNWILRENQWQYRPAPRMEIRTVDTVEVSPSAAKKIIKTAAWFAAGVGVAAIINNNQ